MYQIHLQQDNVHISIEIDSLFWNECLEQKLKIFLCEQCHSFS